MTQYMRGGMHGGMEALQRSPPPHNPQGRWGKMGFQKYHLQHENPYVGVVGPEEKEEDKAGHDLVLLMAVAVAACNNARGTRVDHEEDEDEDESSWRSHNNTRERIEKTVRKILEESDMEKMTEHKIRKQASAELDLDLSDPLFKAFVRYVFKSFLEQQQQEELE
ncbi:RNA polymerase II transcriptional coactivator KELP [Fagus crenata]